MSILKSGQSAGRLRHPQGKPELMLHDTLGRTASRVLIFDLKYELRFVYFYITPPCISVNAIRQSLSGSPEFLRRSWVDLRLVHRYHRERIELRN
jgi:hypothetical protein